MPKVETMLRWAAMAIANRIPPPGVDPRMRGADVVCLAAKRNFVKAGRAGYAMAVDCLP